MFESNLVLVELYPANGEEVMADTDISEQSLLALVIMNTAIKNVRFYPPTSATIVSAIERLHQAFTEMLKQEDPIVFAESDKNILVCGNPLSQKDQEKNQVVALLNILLDFGLKSISLGQGLGKKELSAFTEILSRKPDVIKSDGGLPVVFAKNNITHIYLDQKVYVAMDKDKKIISSLDISDEQIANSIVSAHPALESNPEKIKEMTKDLGETGSSPGESDSQDKIDFKDRLMAVSAKMSLRLKDNENTVLDEQLMSVLPKIIEQLTQHQEQETMQQIISCLVDNMFSKNDEVRANAAKALTDIIDKLPREQQIEMIESVSGQLVEWIKIETFVTPAYKIICNYLQNIAQDFIRQQRFAEAVAVLNIFDGINSGTPEKNEIIQEICARLILNLATEENITFLFNEYNTNEHKKEKEAGKVLSMFGDITLNRMLDNLQADIGGNERVRIMHLIIGAGQRAIPLVRERIHKDEPWYYLRNMAYILGQIGNEESAGTLQQLLSHENDKLKHEALKSISKTGGNRRGTLLTSALPGADEKFKLKIIEALGSAKAADSVPDLIKMLTTRAFVTTETRSLLEEGICNALGAIGSPEAIPVLSEIAESKSFLRIRSYPDKLKSAAARALESIRKKQVDGMPKIDISR